MLALCVLALARSAAEAQAEQAQAKLRARCTALWPLLPAAKLPAFSRAERHWLHVQRWDEQRRCIDALADRQAPGAAAAHCVAEVTLRYPSELPPAAMAAR